jgi:hypothetical protein
MSVPQYNVFADWNADGDFSDSGEDVSARTLSTGVRWERGRDQVRQLAPPFAGALDATLDNTSGDYSPENTGSPLYGLVEPGRELKIEAVSGGTTTLFRGILEEPSIDSEGQTLGIRALGRLSKLAGQKISSQVYTGIATSVAFGHVCRLAGLAASEYTALDTGKTTLNHWWCDEDDAFDMLGRILAAEGPGAAIYEQADGKIAFHSRHYRLLTSRCTTSQATFRDTGTDPLHVSPYTYNRGAAGVVNSASIAVKAATLAVSDTTVWDWSGSVFIPPGQTRSWYLDLDDPIYNPAVTPTYDAGHLSATFQAYPDTGSPVSGQRLRLDLLNDSGTFGFSTTAVGVTVTAIAVLARVYSSAEEAVSSAVSATVVRTLPSSYNPWPYIARATAQDFCDAIVNAYQTPRAVVTITAENGSATDLAQILAREISDRITIVDARSHVNHEFFIERMAHEISDNGQTHRLTLGCEKVGAIDWLIWDTDDWDEASWAY